MTSRPSGPNHSNSRGIKDQSQIYDDCLSVHRMTPETPWRRFSKKWRMRTNQVSRDPNYPTVNDNSFREARTHLKLNLQNDVSSDVSVSRSDIRFDRSSPASQQLSSASNMINVYAEPRRNGSSNQYEESIYYDRIVNFEKQWTCRALLQFCVFLLIAVAVSVGIVVVLFVFVAEPRIEEKFSKIQAADGNQAKAAHLTADQVITSHRQKDTSSPQRASTCGVHVYLGQQNSSLSTTGDVFDALTGWDDRGDTAYIGSQCASYNKSEGTFKILQAGMYTIYSHLAFIGPSDSAKKTYGQKIYKVSEGTPLISDYQSLDQRSKTNVPVHSSHLSATVRLRMNDMLYVRAIPAAYVYREPGSGLSYFGFYKYNVGE